MSTIDFSQIKREKELIRSEMERVVERMQRLEQDLDSNRGTSATKEELIRLKNQLTELRSRMKKVMEIGGHGNGSGVGAGGSSSHGPTSPVDGSTTAGYGTVNGSVRHPGSVGDSAAGRGQSESQQNHQQSSFASGSGEGAPQSQAQARGYTSNNTNGYGSGGPGSQVQGYAPNQGQSLQVSPIRRLGTPLKERETTDSYQGHSTASRSRYGVHDDVKYTNGLGAQPGLYSSSDVVANSQSMHRASSVGPGEAPAASLEQILSNLRVKQTNEKLLLRQEYDRLLAAMERRHADEVRNCQEACAEAAAQRRAFEESRLRMELAQRNLQRLNQSSLNPAASIPETFNSAPQQHQAPQQSAQYQQGSVSGFGPSTSHYSNSVGQGPIRNGRGY
jgi:hypothetical protein